MEEEKINRTTQFEKEAMMLPFKLLVIVSALLASLALIFEVENLIRNAFDVYIARLAVMAISLIVLIFLNTRFGHTKFLFFVHLQLFITIFASAYIVYRIPERFTFDISTAALVILLISLTIGWRIIHQSIVFIYTIVLFVLSVYMSTKNIRIETYLQPTTFFILIGISSIVTTSLVNKFRKNISSQLSETLAAPQNIPVVSPSEKPIFEEIVTALQDGIIRANLDGTIIFANEAAAKILGFNSITDLLKCNLEKEIYVEAEDRKKLIKVLQVQGKVKNFRIKLRKKDEGEIFVRTSERLAKDTQNSGLFIESQIQDITQQVKTEDERKNEIAELKLEQKKAIKDINTALYTGNIKAQFLASMSHEIKTPINSIIGFLTLIEKGMFESEHELKDFAGNAKTAADSLLDIINNILDISKIEAGKMELDDVKFDIREEINKAKSIITPSASAKKLNLNFEIDSEIPFELFGDPTRYRQVALNVLSNAVKYTENGEIRFKLDLISKTEVTVKLKTTIIDTGRGIPQEKMSILFKPYTQLKPKKWTQKDGAGLGLMICKEFVNLMGGDISLDSEEGIGTTVQFTVVLKTKKEFVVGKAQEKEIPVERETPIEKTLKRNNLTFGTEFTQPELKEVKKEEKEKDITPQVEEPEVVVPVKKKKRLLLVEDNPISQKVEHKLLSDSGYDVEAVSNALDAIEAVKTSSFDLVLMDVEMPDMDGLTATQKIRGLDPPSNKIPIIAVTAHSSMKDREKCLAAGMDDYIAKPININFMKMTIDQWLYRNS